MWSQEEKLQIVRLHLEQNIPTRELHRRFGVNSGLVSVWCRQYENYGAERLRSQNGIPRQHSLSEKKKEPIMTESKKSSNRVNSVFGAVLQKYRENMGYSQHELAEKASMSQQHISQVETGKRNLGLDKVVELGKILNFTLSDVESYLNTPDTTITIAEQADLAEIASLNSLIPESQLARRIDAQQVYVLWTPAEMVGICVFSMYQVDIFSAEVPMLTWLYIDSAYCKKGYGTELLTHWENAMHNAGYDRVLISVGETELSRFFFERRGYKYCGECSPGDKKFLKYRKIFE